jgi:hypothetical protein
MFLRRDLGCREVLPKPFYFRLHVEMDFYEACVALVFETVRTLPALVDGARSYLLLRMEEDIIQRALSLWCTAIRCARRMPFSSPLQ